MKFRVTSDRPVRIPGNVMVSQNLVNCVSQDGRTYRFTPDMIGDYVRLPITQNKTLGPAQFSVSADGSQLMGISPLVGTFVTAFANFGADKDQPPMWKTQQGGERKPNGRGGWFVTKDRLYYLAILEILNGDWQGTQLVHILDYLFVDDGTGHADISGRRKGVDQNEAFLRVAGFDAVTDLITYSPNVLPELETLLQSKGTQFFATVEGGLVTSVFDFPVGVNPNQLAGTPMPAPQQQPQSNSPQSNPLPRQFVNPGSRPAPEQTPSNQPAYSGTGTPVTSTYPTQAAPPPPQPIQPAYPPQPTMAPPTQYQPPSSPPAYTETQLKKDLGYPPEPSVDPEFSQPPTLGGMMPTQPEQYEIPPEFDPLTRDKLPKNPVPQMPPALPSVPYSNAQAGVVTPFPSQPSAPPQPVKGK